MDFHRVLANIVHFLEQEQAGAKAANPQDAIDQQNRQEVIDIFKNSKGECAGLTALWCYGRRISDEPDHAENLNPMDDAAFFDRTYNKLAFWDGKEPLSPEEYSDINRFIQLVNLFQRGDTLFSSSRSVKQSDLSVLMEDTRRGSPTRSLHKEEVIVTRQMLTDILQEIVEPQTLIMIGARRSEGHVLGVYKSRDGALSFFDQNHGVTWGGFTVQATDIKELSELVWEGTKIDGDNSELLLRNLHVRVFRFPGDPEQQYNLSNALTPSHEALSQTLKTMNWMLEHTPEYSLLHSFINTLNDKQLRGLLQDEMFKPEGHLPASRKILFDTAINRGCYASPVLARYLLREQADTLAAMEKDGTLSAEQKEKLEQCATRKLQIKHYGEHRQSPEHVLEQYDNGAIDHTDIAFLNLQEVCTLISPRPQDMLLAADLLQHCSTDTSNIEYLHLTYAATLARTLQDKSSRPLTDSSAACAFIEQVGKRFNLVPTLKLLEDFNNPDLINTALTHFGEHSGYCDNWGRSRLPDLLEQIGPRNAANAVRTMLNKIEFTEQSITEDERTKLNAKAEEGAAHLPLFRMLKVAALNPGNKALIEKLLPHAKPCEEWEVEVTQESYTNAVTLHLEQGCAETALIIHKRIQEHFNFTLPPELKARLDAVEQTLPQDKRGDKPDNRIYEILGDTKYCTRFTLEEAAQIQLYKTSKEIELTDSAYTLFCTSCNTRDFTAQGDLMRIKLEVTSNEQGHLQLTVGVPAIELSGNGNRMEWRHEGQRKHRFTVPDNQKLEDFPVWRLLTGGLLAEEVKTFPEAKTLLEAFPHQARTPTLQTAFISEKSKKVVEDFAATLQQQQTTTPEAAISRGTFTQHVPAPPSSWVKQSAGAQTSTQHRR